MNREHFFDMRNSFTRVLLLLGCGSLALWIVFGHLIVPQLIESAYQGKSYPFLNRMIHGQAVHDVGFYLRVWNDTAIRVLVTCLAFWLLAIVTSSPAFFRRFVGEATAGSLGAIRMWICAILLISTAWEDLSSFALLPGELREPMGVMRIFSVLPIGYETLISSEKGLWLFQCLTELALVLGMIGWHTRVVIPLAAFCVFLLNGILREYSGFWHQNLIPIYALAVLSFSPCGDGWSVDRLRKIYQGSSVPEPEQASPVYGWSRYVCWVAIALPYLEAGLSKLRAAGVSWTDATNMRNLLFEQTLYPRKGEWGLSLYLAPAPDIVFVLLGIAAISGELFFVLVLFSRAARKILPAITLLMHVGIVFLQNIVFFDLILLQFVFYDFTKVRRKLAQWLGSGRPIEVLYDDFCPRCLRTVRLLHGLDLFSRMEFHGIRRMDLTEYNRSHALNLTSEALQKQMYVISNGRPYVGFFAYRVIALAVPMLWPLVPWLFLPGVPSLGASLYGYFARQRLAALQCNADCPSGPVEDSNSVVTPVSSPHSYRRYVIMMSGLTAAVLFTWSGKIEFYPFTSVQMFTSPRNSVVTYYKVVGQRESGLVSKAYFEDAIGAWSINSRYEALFDLCFGHPTEIEICKKSLAVLGSAYNKKVSPEEKLTRYELQKWMWDFRANPSDPQYGKMVGKFVFDIGPESR
jgi:predicted DCC family thiol-disulfide oxidoreductase YuxK